MKQQILWRVAADAEFRKRDQVRIVFFAGADRIVDDLRGIASNVADGKVDLCKRHFDRVIHCYSATPE